MTLRRRDLAGCLLGVVAWLLPTAAEEPPYKQLLRGDDAKAAAALFQKVEQYHESGEFAAAICISEELLALQRRVLGETHHETVTNRWQLDGFRRALVATPDQQAAWRTVKRRGAAAEALEKKGNPATVLAIRQELLELSRAVLSEDHPATAKASVELAAMLSALGKSAEAEKHARIGLATYEKTLGKEHPETAACLLTLAQQLNSQGKDATSEPLIRRALEISLHALGPKHEQVGTCCNTLAGTVNRLGRPAEAEHFYREALAIRRSVHGDDHPLTAPSWSNLAVNLHIQGRYSEADPLFRKVLDIWRMAFGDESTQTAFALGNVGSNLNGQGKFAEAEAFYAEALKIRLKLLGENHPSTAGSYNSVAYNLFAQGRHAEAEPIFRKALALRTALLGRSHPDTVTSLNNLSSNLLIQEKLDEAETHIREALDSTVKRYGKEHPDVATYRNNLATCMERQGRPAEAEPLFREALEYSRRSLGDIHPTTRRACMNLGFNLNRQRKYAEAEPLWRAAARSMEAARLRAAATGIERATFDVNYVPQLGLAVSLLHLQRPAEAWQALEGYLGRGLLDEYSAQQLRVLNKQDQEEVDRLRGQLTNAERDLAAFLRLPEASKQQPERLAALIADRQAAQDRLEQLAADIQARELYDLKTVQSRLPAGAALLTWVDQTGSGASGPPSQEHWAFLLKRHGDPILVRLPGTGANGVWTREDSSRIDLLRERIAARAVEAGVDLIKESETLARQRLSPLEPHLKDVRHLIVLPSALMAGFPIEALTEQFTVSYAPSGTMFARLREKPRSDATPRRILALGNPHFKPQGEKAERGPALAPLPGTRREVEAITALFPESRRLLGEHACNPQLAALEATLNDYDVLHLATHAVPNGRIAFDSALFLTQTPTDDGRLTAGRIKDRWRLRAELVALSACASGLGRHAGGEGYLGFTQALFLAGARSILVSQWQVSDTATALLMVRFYENWLGRDATGAERPRLTKAEALKEAKHWLRNLTRKEVEERIANLPEAARGLKLEPTAGTSPAARDNKPFAHPYFWSAFILIGDPH